VRCRLGEPIRYAQNNLDAKSRFGRKFSPSRRHARGFVGARSASALAAAEAKKYELFAQSEASTLA
jgi:hypothetical protein